MASVDFKTSDKKWLHVSSKNFLSNSLYTGYVVSIHSLPPCSERMWSFILRNMQVNVIGFYFNIGHNLTIKKWSLCLFYWEADYTSSRIPNITFRRKPISAKNQVPLRPNEARSAHATLGDQEYKKHTLETRK